MRRTPPAPAPCEPLEPRRLLAVELLSLSAAGLASGNGPSPAAGDSLFLVAPALPVSDDGRYVAFSSNATNLVAGLTTSGDTNVYVRDRLTGTTQLASVRADGQPAGGAASAGISGDGRYVVFTSVTQGVVPGDAGGEDVFLRDTVANTTALVSHTPAGTSGASDSFYPSISRNGRYVTFLSTATDLVPGTPERESGNLYRYDVLTGAVQAVTDAAVPAGFVVVPQISDDGNVISFDLGTVEANNTYVRDMTTGAVTLASVTASGEPVNGAGDYASELSGDGRHVLFSTNAQATPNDQNQANDVFVRDLVAGTTTLVSVGLSGTSAPAADAVGSLQSVAGPSISADGRYVVFDSGDELTGVPDRPGPTRFTDVFLRDMVEGTTRLISVDPPGVDPEESFLPTISADGRFVAMLSNRPASAFGPTQLIITNLATSEQTVANATPAGGVVDIGDQAPLGYVFSRGGGVFVFGGSADVSTLVPSATDANAGNDLFALPVSGLGADAAPPTAAVQPLPALAGAAPFYDFDVTWSDNGAISAASLGDGDVVVTGPAGFLQPATLLGVNPAANAPQIVARYRVQSPGGVFDAAYNGAYQVEAAAGQVTDTAGNAHPGGPLAGGAFVINVPLPATGPDLVAGALRGIVPPRVVGGTRQKVRPLLLTVTNNGNQPAAGAVTLRLLASDDAIPDAADAVVAEIPGQKLKLAPGKSKNFKLKVGAFPAIPDGDYRLIAMIDAGGVLPERLESNNVAALSTPVRIAAPFSDLGVSAPVLTGRLAAGKKASLAVTLRNDGNQPATGAAPVRVRLTADPANPAAPAREVRTTFKLNLKPGASRLVRAKLTLPADLTPGSYFVAIELLTPDADASDNVATGEAPVTV